MAVPITLKTEGLKRRSRKFEGISAGKPTADPQIASRGLTEQCAHAVIEEELRETLVAMSCACG
jgi:hypothetical protein